MSDNTAVTGLSNPAPTEGDAYNSARLTEAQRHDLRVTRDKIDQIVVGLRQVQRSLDAPVSIVGAQVTDDTLFRIAGALFSIADASIIAARSVRTVASEITVGKTLED